MTAGIIGVGLIGGSFALVLKEHGMVQKVYGYDNNEDHLKKAIALGIIDAAVSIEELVSSSDIIILAIPVTQLMVLLPAILDKVNKQVVIDVGSTKQGIVDAIKNHRNRSRFVATHPMWGTEYSGPEAAQKTAFRDKAVVICNKHETAEDAIELAENIYCKLGMHIIYMDAKDHDVHVAYVSHISHITSFALANTVLEKEKEEDAIFELASGGFESTVRLAKSSPETWKSIFIQNRENVLDVLNEHISQLRKFKASLEKENYAFLEELMVNANKIKKIIR